MTFTDSPFVSRVLSGAPTPPLLSRSTLVPDAERAISTCPGTRVSSFALAAGVPGGTGPVDVPAREPGAHPGTWQTRPAPVPTN